MTAPLNNESDRQEWICDQIKLWVGNKKIADALEREAVAQLEGAVRHFSLHKADILSDMEYCRANPRHSAALAIKGLIYALCDNNEGCCRLSVRRMAELYGRTDRSIRESIDSLEEAGVITVDRPDGLPPRYWPRVPSFLKEVGVSVYSFVKALSTAPKAWGRPARPDNIVVSKSSPDNTETKNPGTSVPPFNGKNPGTSVPGFSENPGTVAQKTPEQLFHISSLIESTKEDSRPAVDKAPPIPDGFVDFWKAYPRKDARKAAEQIFRRLVKAGVATQDLIDGAKRYAQRVARDDPKFTAMATTWLNQGRWEDPVANRKANQPRSRY